MRSRFTIGSAAEILDAAEEINVKLLKSGGRVLGVAFELKGELLTPLEDDDDQDDLLADESKHDRAVRLMSYLLGQGGAQ